LPVGSAMFVNVLLAISVLSSKTSAAVP
jgi:hypothetical protein